MLFVPPHRSRPPSWAAFKAKSPHAVLLPFLYFTWLADWAAYGLHQWPLVELLEYLGSFSVLFAVIFYFAGAGDRLKQKHYQAWQVINTAQGKGGNGGRLDALQELNADKVILIGVDVSGAYLEGVRLEHGRLRRADFSACDLRRANFSGAELADASFASANLRDADLTAANLEGASFTNGDLTGTRFARANLARVSFANADLVGCDFASVSNWQAVVNWSKANIHGLRNAPAGLIEQAKKTGAVDRAPAE